MHQPHHPNEPRLSSQLTFEQKLTNYNQDAYTIKVFEALLDSNTIDKTNPNYSTFLDKFLSTLLFKHYVDNQLLQRKLTIQQNKSLFKKIRREYQQLAGDHQSLIRIIDEQLIPLTLASDSDFEITNTIKNQISEINSHRLDGVWSRNMIEVYYDLDRQNIPYLNPLDSTVSQMNGHTSYGFYFLRGGLEFTKILKHYHSNKTLFNQHNIDFKRLCTEIEPIQRQVVIANDLVWGIINFVTYFEFNKEINNPLTALLLFADFMFTAYQCYLENNKHNNVLSILNNIQAPNEWIEFIKKQHHQSMNSYYGSIGYGLCLCLAFSALVASNYPLLAAKACLFLQFFINIKDLILAYREELNPSIRNDLILKILARIFIQALIPSLFLISTFYLLPVLPGLTPLTTTLGIFALSTVINYAINSVIKAKQSASAPVAQADIEDQQPKIPSISI
jgi:hypothetical protein